MSSPKRERPRRIHMDAASCSEYASSSEGIKPLVAPSLCEKTVNNRKKKHYQDNNKLNSSLELASTSFSRASPSFLPSGADTDEIEPMRKRKKKAAPTQSNNLLNYLEKVKPIINKPKDNVAKNKCSQQNNDSSIGNKIEFDIDFTADSDSEVQNNCIEFDFDLSSDESHKKLYKTDKHSNKCISSQKMEESPSQKMKRDVKFVSSLELASTSFCRASDVYLKRGRSMSPTVPKNEFLPSVADSDEIEPRRKRREKEAPSRSNNLLNYLEIINEPKDNVAKNKCSQQNNGSSIGNKIEFYVDLTADSDSDVPNNCFKFDFDLSSDERHTNKFSKTGKHSAKRISSQMMEKSPSCFGLFGATDADTNEPDYFNHLPTEVMEHIFCQIPFQDLQNCKRVCHLWNDVIDNESFMHWKTIYYKLKHGCAQETKVMRDLLKSIDGHSANNCLMALIRYMRNGFSRKPAIDMLKNLKKHKKYIAAESVLKERFPDSSENITPWSIVATIVLISEEVTDVYYLILMLLIPKSHTLTVDVLECLYCIASFLLYYMNVLNINHGLHYRVYYSLYMYENHVPLMLDYRLGFQNASRQIMPKYCCPRRTTFEQDRVASHCLQKGDIIKVMAFAGSGKTSTLIELARRNPEKSFLNIMYNKSVCDHAQKLFPANVKCQTAHSLAFASKGRQFRHRFSTKLNPDVIRNKLQLKDYPFNVLQYCKTVEMTLQNFMASSDMELTIKHCPGSKPVPRGQDNRRDHQQDRCALLTPDEKLHISQSANRIWTIILDPEQNIPVVHDVYLKLYQMSKPVIDRYHCIMVDEAQDCNPAMLDIILSQKVPVILVGDPHQQIYGFRGTRNALQEVESTHVYHLTKSFRFGPEIAYVASCCIEVLKRYKRQTLVGSIMPSTVAGIVEGQYAIIARTNYGLFNEAIRLCCQRNFKHDDEPRLIHGAFIGGLTNYGLNQIEDIYKLKALSGRSPSEVSPAERPTDKFISSFKRISDLVSYAVSRDDQELIFKIDIVNQHNEKIPEYIDILRKTCNTTLELANVVFTTAHKAKGFEFDTVRLVDDYNIGKTVEEIASRGSEEEYNILYVALTRAKRSLFLTDKLYNVLLLAQEKFEFPVLSKEIKLQEAPTCVLCFSSLQPHTVLSLVRREVTLTTGRRLKEGPMCVRCASAPYYRPQVVRDPIIMYLDPIEDIAHKSLRFLVGPLPSDPPETADFDFFPHMHVMDLIYVINVRGHV